MIHRYFILLVFAGLTLNTQASLVGWFQNEVPEGRGPNTISFSTQDLTILVKQQQSFDVIVNGTLDQTYTLTFDAQHDDLLDIEPESMQIRSEPGTYNVTLTGVSPGSLVVTGKLGPSSSFVSDENLYIRVKVAMNDFLIHFSVWVGWIYFAAWSISFYPQVWINFKRKSVVGLSFDFLALNFVGHTLYAIFNIGLYWIPAIQDQYFEKFPRGMNPVLLNDVFFSIHASIITIVTISQCFFFERGDQRVSWTARGFMTVFAVVIIVTGGLAIGSVMLWLDFLYTLSYIKLAITLMKYVPQAVLNYRRKSTSGWSIGNILLDFTGGILSMLQMILNAYNYDDWVSIFGDPTKFGLGLFSVCFDILFITQHYVLYRERNNYEQLEGTNSVEPDPAVENYQEASSNPAA